MRLVTDFQTEKQAFEFQLFLQNHGINSFYEQALDAEHKTVYRVWVFEEDQLEAALSYVHQWGEGPSSQSVPTPQKLQPEWKVRGSTVKAGSFSLTQFLIMVCGFLFLWSTFQAGAIAKKQGEIALEYVLTPIQKTLLFDDPVYLEEMQKFLEKNSIRTEEDLKKLSPGAQKKWNQIQNAPTWKGFSEIVVKKEWSLIEEIPAGTLFGKIRQGELWRLITPVFLHGNWLHLIFNMAWLFILGRQVEERLGKGKFVLFSLLVGVIGNVAQYLASGPVFLGYSGIITGMVGLIWIRQKIAPWEGYPLQKPVILFLAIFVAIMAALGVLAMTLQFFHVTDTLFSNTANAAHIIGGLCGIALGRLPFFARRN